jgi:hypothetical protein
VPFHHVKRWSFFSSANSQDQVGAEFMRFGDARTVGDDSSLAAATMVEIFGAVRTTLR